MKNALSILVIVETTILFSACGGVNYHQEIDPVTAMYDSIERADSMRRFGPAKEVNLAEVKNQETGIRVVVEGYLRIGTTITENANGTYVELWERKLQRTGEQVAVMLQIGTAPNERKPLPDSTYDKTDFVVYAQDSSEIHFNDYVRLTGLITDPTGDTFFIELQSVERVPEKKMDYLSMAPTQVAIDRILHPGLEGKMVAASGYINIPSGITVTDVAPLTLSKEYGEQYGLSVNITIGNQPNMIEELPDQYTEADLKIHDHTGAITEQKKVTVYGIWNNQQIDVEYIQLAE